MSKVYRIGVIGFAHMHINHLVERFAAHPQTELAACADTPALVPELRAAHYTRAWNLRHALDDLGMPKAYDDYQTMLEQRQSISSSAAPKTRNILPWWKPAPSGACMS